MSSLRSFAAIVVALATAGAGCSSKSSSAPAQAGSDLVTTGSGRTVAPIHKPVRPGMDGSASTPSSPSSSSDPLANGHGDFRDRMRAFDTDGDGKLSEDERAKMLAARAGAMLARIDTNGDGVLSKAEVDASPAAQRLGDFAVADTDHNGSLSADEFGAAIVAAMKQAGGFRAWRGTRGDGTVPTPSPDDGGE